MSDHDKVTAAAERMQTCRAAGWQLEGSAYEKPSGVANMRQWTSDTRMLLTAYLAHPPLTRERVEKAVGELLDGIRGATGGHEPFDRVWLIDRLCRLLGILEGE